MSVFSLLEVVVRKNRSLEKKVFLWFRVEIIWLDVFNERNNIIFDKKIKTYENNTSNNVFCNRIFSYEFFKNYCICINYGLFFGENIL